MIPGAVPGILAIVPRRDSGFCSFMKSPFRRNRRTPDQTAGSELESVREDEIGIRPLRHIDGEHLIAVGRAIAKPPIPVVTPASGAPIGHARATARITEFEHRN